MMKLIDPPLRRSEMVYVMAFWPHPEAEQNEWARWAFEQQYAAIASTFNVRVMLIDDPSENKILKNAPFVSLEEHNNHRHQVWLDDFEHPETAIYVTGNSRYRWPVSVLPEAQRVKIPTPVFNAPLYGDQALAIALYDRAKKRHGDELKNFPEGKMR